MNSNERKPIVNKVFDTKMKTLMSIRNFQQDFISHAQILKDITQDLTQRYENGLNFLNQNGDLDHQKEWEELLNNVRVEANQMNQILSRSGDFMLEDKMDYDFLGDYNEFETRKNQLKDASLKFENSGTKSLSDDSLDEWNLNYVVWDEHFEEKFINEGQFIQLIYDFEDKYSHEDLNRITEILTQNSAGELDWNNPAVYEQQYIKAIQEFQREFKPRNLWDNIMEILAGGVHPSPSERMMLEQWTDGEQKTREDM